MRERGSAGGGRDQDFRPLEVSVQDDNIGRALSILKRKMAAEGVLKELKKRRFFEKPSEKKKRKQREAERRRRKALFGKPRKAKGTGRGRPGEGGEPGAGPPPPHAEG